MRIEIADFQPSGRGAPMRAGAGPAVEPKERFTLPSEPADRRAASGDPAPREAAAPVRAPDASAGSGVDRATAVAAQALAEASALRREEALVQKPDASTEAESDIAPIDQALFPKAAAGEGEAESAAAPDGDQRSDEQAGTSDQSEVAAAPSATAPFAPIALQELEIDADAPSDDTQVTETESSADAPRAAAGLVGAENAAKPGRGSSGETPVDGQAVAEAVRAMRGLATASAAPTGDADDVASDAEAEADAKAEAGSDPSAAGDDGRPSPPPSADAARSAPVDLEDARARAMVALSGNNGQSFGLASAAAGGDAAEQVIQQAGSAQSGSLQSAALQAEAARAAAAQQPTVVVPQTALAAVPVAIGLKALNGVSNFQIRLDPAELGRIDVSLEIDGEGTVNAKLVVDRVETLQLLQRDARTLERAFEQAGLKPSEGGLDLSLRDSGGGDRQSGREAFEERRGGAYGRSSASGDETGALDPGASQTLIAQAALRRALGGVDLRI